MDKPQKGPLFGSSLEPRFHVRVEHQGRPPTPWAWAIYKYGRADALHRSVNFYRSADEAWEAGRAALTHLEKPAETNEEWP